jgi:hypothetical protein
LIFSALALHTGSLQPARLLGQISNLSVRIITTQEDKMILPILYVATISEMLDLKTVLADLSDQPLSCGAQGGDVRTR